MPLGARHHPSWCFRGWHGPAFEGPCNPKTKRVVNSTSICEFDSECNPARRFYISCQTRGGFGMCHRVLGMRVGSSPPTSPLPFIPISSVKSRRPIWANRVVHLSTQGLRNTRSPSEHASLMKPPISLPFTCSTGSDSHPVSIEKGLKAVGFRSTLRRHLGTSSTQDHPRGDGLNLSEPTSWMVRFYSFYPVLSCRWISRISRIFQAGNSR